MNGISGTDSEISLTHERNEKDGKSHSECKWLTTLKGDKASEFNNHANPLNNQLTSSEGKN